jgi:hypothetical protein
VSNIERDVVAEIERLHDFFAGWFAGDASRSLDEFTSTLGSGFYIIGPDATIRRRSEIVDLVEAGFGRRAVAIRIENAVVMSQVGEMVFATYEEHQTIHDAGTARRSSVAMTADPSVPHGWRWITVSETWMPGSP